MFSAKSRSYNLWFLFVGWIKVEVYRLKPRTQDYLVQQVSDTFSAVFPEFLCNNVVPAYPGYRSVCVCVRVCVCVCARVRACAQSTVLKSGTKQ
jgi:hypothetical protein